MIHVSMSGTACDAGVSGNVFLPSQLTALTAFTELQLVGSALPDLPAWLAQLPELRRGPCQTRLLADGTGFTCNYISELADLGFTQL